MTARLRAVFLVQPLLGPPHLSIPPFSQRNWVCKTIFMNHVPVGA